MMEPGHRHKLITTAKDIGDAFKPSSPYFARAEQSAGYLWDKHAWPMVNGCDFTRVVDLACGHGRYTARLKEISRSVVAMDINEENVAVCRERPRLSRGRGACPGEGRPRLLSSFKLDEWIAY